LSYIAQLAELLAHLLEDPTLSRKKVILPIPELINDLLFLAIIERVTLARKLVGRIFAPLRLFILLVIASGAIGHLSDHIVIAFALAEVIIGPHILIARTLLVSKQNIT
jgi:hypothetical protein